MLFDVKVNCDKNSFSVHSFMGFQNVQTANRKKDVFIVKLICIGNMTKSDASLLLGFTIHVMLTRNDNWRCNSCIINIV